MGSLGERPSRPFRTGETPVRPVAAAREGDEFVALLAKADFEVLEKRIPQYDLPSRDEPSTNDVPYAANVARFEKAGTPVLLAWYSHRIPSEALVFDTVRLSVPGVAFKDPVWMDMVTGRVFEIDANDIETQNGTTVFKRLPLWDSPVLLAERGQVELTR